MSEDFQRYPYSGEYITLKDAVAFICVVVYPDSGRDKDEKVKAKKRVRRRICQAGEDGLLHILERERDRRYWPLTCLLGRRNAGGGLDYTSCLGFPSRQ